MKPLGERREDDDSVCYYWKLSCGVAQRQPAHSVGADRSCVGGYVGARGCVGRRGNSPGGGNIRTLGFHVYIF